MRLNQLWSLLLLAFLGYPAFATTYYVNQAATGSNNGTSWANAYTDLQSALTNGSLADGDEVWIAKGTYYPTNTANTAISFEITKGISVYGHFDGTEQSISERDLSDALDLNASRTVLSGNIGAPGRLDNTAVVVNTSALSGDILINGVTIEEAIDAGMIGGGIQGVGFEIQHTLFYNNESFRGGGIYFDLLNDLTIDNCRFLNNNASEGPAMAVGSANLIIRNTDFIENTAAADWGAMSYFGNGTATIENCSFSQNTSNSINTSSSTCIFGLNSLCTINVYNSIFWDNGATTHLNEIVNAGTTNASDCIIEGGFTGTNILNQNPLWIDTDLNLDFSSPAIDAGDNTLYTSPFTIDIDGDHRFSNTTIDLGSQERSGSPNDFVITLLGSSVNIPTFPGLTYSYTVDWGDGSQDLGQTNSASHTYTDGIATHEVRISGTFPAIYYNNGTAATQLISIDQWGAIQWSTMRFAFYGCSNMTYQATDVPDLSGVINMGSMFRNCSQFNGDIGDWDVTTINNMGSLFQGATSYEGIGLENWERTTAGNTSSLGNLVVATSMFQGASAFNGNISNWNTGQVTSLLRTFLGATVFNRPLNWNTSSVTSMFETFSAAHAFDQDISDWDMSSVTNMQSMFHPTNSFNNGGNPLDWGTDLNGVTNMKLVFRQAIAFNQPLDWDVSTVTNMNAMFSFATLFDQDLSAWDVSMVEDMEKMFKSATVFNNGGVNTLSNWERTASGGSSASTLANVKNMREMFNNADAFNQSIDNWDVSSVTNMSGMFGLTDAFNQPLDDWGTKLNGVLDMSKMFLGAQVFNQPLNSWDVSTVTNMFLMFSVATNFNGNISDWSTGSVTNMSYMFTNSHAFNQDIGNWSTGNVTDMRFMFANAYDFNQDIGDWDIEDVTSLFNMLNNAGMDECHYDAMLEGWLATYAGNAPELNALGVNYGTPTHRNALIAAGLTTIVDAGQGTVCANPLKTNPENDPSTAETLSETLQLYPNPAKDAVSISGIDGLTSVTIINVQGKTVLSQSLTENESLSVRQLSPGLYMVQVADDMGHQAYLRLLID